MSETGDFTMGIGFRSAADRVRGEREQRLLQAQNVLSFGVRYLDVVLGGIFRNDLILLGAKTGTGKTALAANVARANVLNGKRVHFFALEAEPNEIERRIKYQLLARSAYAKLGERLNYVDWYLGKVDSSVRPFEREAEELLSHKYRTLSTFYRERDFSIDDLSKLILAIQDETDLIVVDHVHFIDSDDENENRALKVVTKKLRDIAISIGRPVLLLAHIRKGDRRVKQLIPTLDDFHGSSDLPKIATKAIMLGPVETPSKEPHLWGTYMQAAKCRFDGSRTRYVAQVTFNARTQVYEDEFILGRMKNGGEEFECVPANEMPFWARTEVKPQEDLFQ